MKKRVTAATVMETAMRASDGKKGDGIATMWVMAPATKVMGHKEGKGIKGDCDNESASCA